jgi:lysyl-tRNA synthetase class 2
MGKLIFADIEDTTGKMQICIRRDEYPREAPSSKLQAPNNSQVPIANDTSAEAKSDASTAQQSRSNQVLSWSELKYLDLGDFIQVAGTLDKTQAGEITLFASEIVLLSKALRPYPNKMDDKDERYRRRYVDMVLHPAVREVTKRKGTFWQTIRNVLVARGFTEIFLPVLEHTTGGADAKPFMTHHNTLDEDLYLRISLELYSKRAIGAGFEKVFSIGPVFRNEGMSDEHANEFNHIEWYWAYADYQDQMKLTREVMIEAAKAVYGKTNFTSRGHSFDLAGEWKQIDYASAIKEKFNVDIFTTSDADIKKILINEGVELDGAALNRQRMIDNLWKLIRKTISGPAFLVNEPAFMSPLAKAKTDDPRLTERFHVVMAGTELANGYSEINDPIYQLEQFRAQESMRESGDAEAQMLDIDFVEMLEYGMPPTTGLGFSERLFWFLEDITAREGAMFPILRNEVDALTKKIYPDIYKSKKTQTQDFGQKIAIVVDDTLPQWQIANAVSHVSAFIGNKLAHTFATGEYFVTNDGKTHPRNAQYPVVILKASKQSLSSWIPEVRKSKLLYHGFIKEMIETTNDSKIEKLLANKQDSQIDYLAIGVFGNKEQIQTLTKSFALYGSTDSEMKTANPVVAAPNAQQGIGITHDQAWALVTTHIKNVNLQKHCLAVEAAMQSLARHHHADETLWGIVGLLHDADWEECRETPAQHTLKTIEWLKGMGVHNNELIDAILTHAHHVTGYRVPETPLEWSLYCCDELTGLIVASTLVLPTKKIADLTVESVIKKMGSKSFAAAIDREGIKMCQEKLGIDLNTFVDIVLKGMQKESTALGL